MLTPGTDAIAPYALFKPPGPISDCAARCVVALTEYTSLVVPGLTTSVPARDRTFAIVLSVGVRLILTVCT